MKKHMYFFLTIFLLALVGCRNPSGSIEDVAEDTTTEDPTTEDPDNPAVVVGDPTKLDLSGAEGFFLQAGASAGISRAATLDGADLMKVESGSVVETVTFQDADGNTVSASVDKAKILNADYIMMTYTSGATATAIVDMSTGKFSELSVIPDNWDMIRLRGNLAYYVTGTNLYRLDLETMATFIMNSGYPVSSGFYLYPGPVGNVAAVGSPKRYMFNSAGEMSKDMSASPTAERVYSSASVGSNSSTIFALEDESTQQLYLFNFGSSQTSVTEVLIQESGFYENTPNNQTINYPTLTSIVRLGGKQAKFSNTIWTTNDVIFKPSISAGVVSFTNYDQSATMTSYSNPKLATWKDNVIYVKHSYLPDGDTKIRKFDCTGALPVETVVAEGDITDFEVVDDIVFFNDAAVSYKVDTVTLTKTVYEAVTTDIKAVD